MSSRVKGLSEERDYARAGRETQKKCDRSAYNPGRPMADAITSRATTAVRTPTATLDSWSAREWGGGLQLASLNTLDVLHIQTRNTLYEITILDAASAEVLVRGGKFFPEHRRAVLSGSSLGGAFLKMHGIYVDFCMEINTGVVRVVTTAVESISVASTGGSIQ